MAQREDVFAWCPDHPESDLRVPQYKEGSESLKLPLIPTCIPWQEQAFPVTHSNDKYNSILKFQNTSFQSVVQDQ